MSDEHEQGCVELHSTCFIMMDILQGILKLPATREASSGHLLYLHREQDMNRIVGYETVYR